MSRLLVIADDVTGACDVGGEFAAAGVPVRVAVDERGGDAQPGELGVANTQSRAADVATAAARVVAAVRRAPTEVLFKKIDTALRGHLGGELVAAVEASGARGGFVIPALPAAGRATRQGRQWVGDRLLGETEFARDPEGRGAESSVAAVLAHESDWPVAVVDVATVRSGRLAAAAGEAFDAGQRFVVVDAETDADVAAAAAAVLDLPRPLCLAGSVPLASALAAHRELVPDPRPSAGVDALPRPLLIVCGSLHSVAHAQVGALVDAGLADRVAVDGSRVNATVTTVRSRLDGGRSVALEAPVVAGEPEPDALRQIETALGTVVEAVAGAIGSLVLIGGETSYAVLRRLGASELLVHGRPEPLVAHAEIAMGMAAGTRLVTKGGSGGGPDSLRALVGSNTVR